MQMWNCVSSPSPRTVEYSSPLTNELIRAFLLEKILRHQVEKDITGKTYHQ